MMYRFSTMTVLLGLVSVNAGCDPYDCNPETCGDGTTDYDLCISCGGDVIITCTLQTRTPEPEGDDIDECSYESDPMNASASEPCFAQVRAAACE